jgi:putative intracellular protease/amidase
MSEAAAVGNPATDADDVATDGRIVTAQNAGAAAELGRTLGTLMREWLESHPRPVADDAAASLSSPETR